MKNINIEIYFKTARTPMTGAGWRWVAVWGWCALIGRLRARGAELTTNGTLSPFFFSLSLRDLHTHTHTHAYPHVDSST